MGLSTYSRSAIPNNWLKWWHLKWCYFHIILFFVVHFTIVCYYRDILYIGDRFGTLNDFIKIAIVGISHIVILIETAKNQTLSSKFFQAYIKLHQQWADYKKSKNELRIYKKFFLLTLFYILVLCGTDFYYAYEIRDRRQWIFLFIANEPSIWICRFRFIQISMYLNMITMEILQLNRETMKLAKETQKRQLNYDDKLICRKLHKFMQNYQQIFVMVELFKKCCSMSCLVIFVSAYVKILSDCYWIYWVIYNRDALLSKIRFNFFFVFI